MLQCTFFCSKFALFQLLLFFLPNTTIDFPKYLFFCSQPFLSSSQLDKKRLTWQKNQSRRANLETKAVVHRKQFVHPNWQDLVYHFFVRNCQMTKIWEDGGMPKNDQKWWEMGSVKTWPITLRMVTTKIINSDRGGGTLQILTNKNFCGHKIYDWNQHWYENIFQTGPPDQSWYIYFLGSPLPLQWWTVKVKKVSLFSLLET